MSVVAAGKLMVVMLATVMLAVVAVAVVQVYVRLFVFGHLI
jgi:hypothetical protein